MSALPKGYLRRVSASLRFFRIAYWVPHEDDEYEDASPFQGFLPGILRTSNIFLDLTQLPSDIRELRSARSEIAFSRIMRLTAPHLHPIQLTSFDSVAQQSFYYFNCVVSTEETCASIIETLRKTKLAWLHAREGNLPGVEEISAYVANTIASIGERPATSAIKSVFFEKSSRSKPKPIYCDRYHHNLTLPNELALSALNFTLGESKPLRANDPAAYPRAIVRTARALSGAVNSLVSAYKKVTPRGAITIALDSFVHTLSRGSVVSNSLSKLSKRDKALMSAALRRDGYVATIRSLSETKEDDADSLGMAAIGMRSQELRAFTAALAVHSSTVLVPVIRLNPGLNNLRGWLSNISSCARGDGPHREFKLGALFRRLTGKMDDLVDAAVLKAIAGERHAIRPITLVTDFPLEWLRVDGLPLGIRHDTSRIPATPGNIMFWQCVPSEEVHISASSLDELLVIRSFTDGDKISKTLEKALAQRRHKSRTIKIRFHDVSTPEEMQEALRRYNGSILIFDGHGTYDAETGRGSIVIGGKAVDIWALRGKLKLPPIVLLSACDTLPIDGSHGSTAVAMLQLGAVAVLATLLPINAVRSSIFLSRIIFRISEFLPIAMQFQPDGVDWRYFVSGMLRMVYASELIEELTSLGLSTQTMMTIQAKANIDINSRNSRWLDNLLRNTAAHTKKPLEEIREWVNQHHRLYDSLRYVNIGRPELIKIFPEVLEERDAIRLSLKDHYRE